MLPSPVRVSGVVTDSDGKPLSEVSIDHTGVGYVRSDSSGRFDIQTRAPAIVFRKDGFHSKYLRVTGAEELKIVLSGPAPRFRECGAFSGCISLKGLGFMSTFCLPRVSGVNVSKQNNDIDYSQRSFGFATPNGYVGIQHAAGGHWGSGRPLDEQVWSAEEYVETTYRDRDGFLIIDARGKAHDGRHWRVLGHVFETAAYRNASRENTALLGRVLDGACVVRPKSPGKH